MREEEAKGITHPLHRLSSCAILIYCAYRWMHIRMQRAWRNPRLTNKNPVCFLLSVCKQLNRNAITFHTCQYMLDFVSLHTLKNNIGMIYLRKMAMWDIMKYSKNGKKVAKISDSIICSFI